MQRLLVSASRAAPRVARAQFLAPAAVRSYHKADGVLRRTLWTTTKTRRTWALLTRRPPMLAQVTASDVVAIDDFSGCHVSLWICLAIALLSHERGRGTPPWAHCMLCAHLGRTCGCPGMRRRDEAADQGVR
eukprot:3846254-Rhodomonas_salina.3